jgi:HK97 family phage major capsid protein
MSIEERVRRLNEQRMRTWERGREILDRALAEKRTLDAEESANFDRVNDELDRIDKTRDALINSDEARRELEEVNEEVRRVCTWSERSEAERRGRGIVEQFFRRGGPAEIVIDLDHARNVVEAHRAGASGRELRAVLGDGGASGGSLLVPTVLDTTVYSYLTAQSAMRRMPTTKITRPNGDPFQVPRIGTHAIATQVASQNTAYAGTDTVFATTTLNFYTAGQLVDVANDVLEDAAIDMVAVVGGEIAGAIGRLTDQWYVTGSGSGQPQGVASAISGSGTVSTGGWTTDPTVETMIDLEFSVVDSYRNRPSAAWLVSDSAAKVLRKLRSDATAGGTSGDFLWQPSPTRGLVDGQPDRFAGYPIYTDTSVAALASASKSVFFGAWEGFYIADVQGLRLERSTDLRFDKAQTSWRGQLRTASALVDSSAINLLRRSA